MIWSIWCRSLEADWELTVLAAMPSPPAHMLLRLRHRLALRLNSCSERRALDWRIISSLLTRRYSSSSALSSSDRDPSAAFVESRSTRCLSSASKSSVKMARAASGESVPCPGFTTRPQMADAVLLGLTVGCMELPQVKSLCRSIDKSDIPGQEVDQVRFRWFLGGR